MTRIAGLVVQGTEPTIQLPADPHERMIALAKVVGICSVCRRSGFARNETDDSARCDECRP